MNVREHLISLKGKEYLQVMWRLVWFREEHPNWSIVTTLIQDDGERAIFRAEISDEEGRVLSVGHGDESTRDFAEYLTKAETKAVGRALAMLGYGTQFAPELDEGDRVVDSPVTPKAPKAPKEYRCAECGNIISPAKGKNGKPVPIERHIERSKEAFGAALCCDCIERIKAQK